MMARRPVPLLVLATGMMAGCGGGGAKPAAPSYGRFVGEVKAVWDADGRTMRLLEDFGYLDPRDKLWTAPAGSVVDGASIPQPFWSTIGGPFEGKYRNASVVHDVECVRRREPWEAVHRMFYEACLCGGAEPWRSKVLYLAVSRFGPRWERPTAPAGTKGAAPPPRAAAMPAPPPPSADDVRAIAEYVRRNDPSLEEIERIDLSQIRARAGRR